MDTDPDASQVPRPDRQKWDTARREFLGKGTEGDKSDFYRRYSSVTLAAFAGYRPEQRLEIINFMWDKLFEWQPCTKLAKEMYDAPGNDPVHLASSDRVPMAFQRFGIGFRAEKFDDLPRIQRHGFEPLYRNLALRETLGHHVTGTVVDTNMQKNMVALFRKNNDAVGQTGICVSRGLRGATKFPDQEYEGVVCVFAVRPSGRGCDLEDWQEHRKADHTAVWRPGEKVFPSIPTGDILAYTRVQKFRAPDGWTFLFLHDHWTYFGDVKPAETEYLQGELTAMLALGRHNVPKSDDFYGG